MRKTVYKQDIGVNRKAQERTWREQNKLKVKAMCAREMIRRVERWKRKTKVQADVVKNYI